MINKLSKSLVPGPRRASATYSRMHTRGCVGETTCSEVQLCEGPEGDELGRGMATGLDGKNPCIGYCSHVSTSFNIHATEFFGGIVTLRRVYQEERRAVHIQLAYKPAYNASKWDRFSRRSTPHSHIYNINVSTSHGTITFTVCRIHVFLPILSIKQHVHFRNPSREAQENVRGRMPLRLYQVLGDTVPPAAREQAFELRLFCVPAVRLPTCLYVVRRWEIWAKHDT